MRSRFVLGAVGRVSEGEVNEKGKRKGRKNTARVQIKVEAKSLKSGIFSILLRWLHSTSLLASVGAGVSQKLHEKSSCIAGKVRAGISCSEENGGRS